MLSGKDLNSANPDSRPPCVLLFSGGRDSTLAALRLAKAGFRVILATITSDHLVGVEFVRRRLAEIKPFLGADSLWLRVRQPAEEKSEVIWSHQTCLPCHREYLLTGFHVASAMKATAIAFGYVKYQSTWPEQTPYATGRALEVLQRNGLKLVLPVYDLSSKEAAMEELVAFGLTPLALEQKCMQQQLNEVVGGEELKALIDTWADTLQSRLDRGAHERIAVLEEVAHEGW